MDLETGAIVYADVQAGDEQDMVDLTEKGLEGEAQVNDVMEEDRNGERVEPVAGDKGYLQLEEVYPLQGAGIEMAISDPQPNRRINRLSEEDRVVLETARGFVSSNADHGWMRKRSKLMERGFQHVLDSGGARRTTLRDREKARQLYLIEAACADLSLLMGHLAGVAPPRQALAGAQALVFARFHTIRAVFGLDIVRWTSFDRSDFPLNLFVT